MLLAAFRRAGFSVALSQGMRPKPVISLAMARSVGMASNDELLTVELVGEHDPDSVGMRLAETLPRGFGVVSASRSTGTPRLVGARYRVELDASPDLVEQAAALYATAAEAPVERRSPKKAKTVDVKAYAPSVEVVDGGFEVEVAVSHEGSARPEEIARALAAQVGSDLPVTGVVRLELRVAERQIAVSAPGETP